MAKTKPSSKDKKKSKTRSREKSLLHSTGGLSSNPHATPSAPTPAPAESTATLLAAATALLHTNNEPDQALTLATQALQQSPTSLCALELLAEIHVELGDVATAYTLYTRAATLDPNGAHESAGGSGPEKFLWLAQLCPEGGAAAVRWYTTGVEALQRLVALRDGGVVGGAAQKELVERGLERKLVSALCGLAEIYMSDLCMDADAEARCEAYVTQALLAVPDSAEALQTLASVRISQQRVQDAVAALERAVGAWKELEAESPEMPSYAARISQARLLIETEQYETAVEVLERLQAEDDQLPDLWYLGGWTLFLLGERERPRREGWAELWEAAREWLKTCQQLYNALEWEDEGIREHAEELLGKILEVIPEKEGEDEEEADGDEEEEEWESDSADEEMS
ncbi:hypothetical protein BZA05DRAFT_389342 [Tricharina praecox]|uniref:uncharacterized protein n=1 Tax=Tricharina praecox TaxID=43433 RepID=UPI00221F6713|nr:uncharacterized protein BZA05DRAFT_389342 [Tricharina praecox]KAI5855684.1 hypothetical protein BZA05DRAFT_389342 [Tricharina praecox]